MTRRNWKPQEDRQRGRPTIRWENQEVDDFRKMEKW